VSPAPSRRWMRRDSRCSGVSGRGGGRSSRGEGGGGGVGPVADGADGRAAASAGGRRPRRGRRLGRRDRRRRDFLPENPRPEGSKRNSRHPPRLPGGAVPQRGPNEGPPRRVPFEVVRGATAGLLPLLPGDPFTGPTSSTSSTKPRRLCFAKRRSPRQLLRRAPGRPPGGEWGGGQPRLDTVRARARAFSSRRDDVRAAALSVIPLNARRPGAERPSPF